MAGYKGNPGKREGKPVRNPRLSTQKPGPKAQPGAVMKPGRVKKYCC